MPAVEDSWEKEDSVEKEHMHRHKRRKLKGEYYNDESWCMETDSANLKRKR